MAKDNELKAKADDRDYIEANGSYFITKYKEFLNSIEQILAEEKQHEAEKQLELADNKIEENGDIQCKDNGLGSEINNEERKQEINIKLEKAIEAIDDFEADSAIEILQELHTTDMDPVIIEKVCRASELIDDFEYDEAVEILKKLLE